MTLTPAQSSRADEHALAAVIRALRPRQWAKNVLVLAAPFTAGRLLEAPVLLDVLVAAAAFCLVASAVYLLNDVRDRVEDRAHPTKCWRPVALGTLPVDKALLVGGALLAAGLALSWAVRPALLLTLVVYVALQAAYSLRLKHEPVLDVAVVASGFLLRAVAGGAATGITLSPWFLLVSCFGSLFVVAGKRYSEMQAIGHGAGTRLSLQRYSVSYLRFLWNTAAGLTIMAYALWAISTHDGRPLTWAVVSMAPFVLGLLRYAVDIDGAAAGAPEDILLRDPAMLVLGGCWAVALALTVAAG